VARRVATRISLASSAVLLVVPAAAGADVYEGKTSQGKRAEMRTDPSGVPKEIEFSSYRAPCSPGANFYESENSYFRRPFDRVSSERLFDRGRSHFRDGRLGGPVRATVRAKRVSPTRWTGRTRVKVKVRSEGDPILRCATTFRFAVDLSE
jgi:hypothetical protein